MCVCVFLFVCVVLVIVFSVHRILQLHKMYFIILHQNNFGVKRVRKNNLKFRLELRSYINISLFFCCFLFILFVFFLLFHFFLIRIS